MQSMGSPPSPAVEPLIISFYRRETEAGGDQASGYHRGGAGRTDLFNYCPYWPNQKCLKHK